MFHAICFYKCLIYTKFATQQLVSTVQSLEKSYGTDIDFTAIAINNQLSQKLSLQHPVCPVERWPIKKQHRHLIEFLNARMHLITAEQTRTICKWYAGT